MIYVLGGTKQAAEQYAINMLDISPREKKRVRCLAIRNSFMLNGLILEQDDQIVTTAEDLAEQEDWLRTVRLIRVLEGTRREGDQ